MAEETQRFWRVKAGDPGREEEIWSEWENGDLVSIGWGKINLEKVTDKEQIKQLLEKYWPEWTSNARGAFLRSIHAFGQVKKGDMILAYAGDKSVLGFGVVTGRHKYRKELQYENTIGVDWQVKATGFDKSISIRDLIDRMPSLRNLATAPTVIEIKSKDDWKKLEEYIKKAQQENEITITSNVNTEIQLFDADGKIIKIEVDGSTSSNVPLVAGEEETFNDFQDGNYEIKFKEIEGYSTPAAIKFEVLNSSCNPNKASAVYIIKNSLLLSFALNKSSKRLNSMIEEVRF